MRIIIIIQSIIIIILGAYYLYTQSQTKIVVDDAPPTLEVVPMPEVLEGYQPPTENPPDDSDVVTASTTSTVTGPSDAGMEYPTMDAGTLPETR